MRAETPLAPDTAAERLVRLGWLLPLRKRDAWEFAPAARAGRLSGGDPWIELRAVLAHDAAAPVAVAFESAVWELGHSSHQPTRPVVAHRPGWRSPRALDARAVTFDWRVPAKPVPDCPSGRRRRSWSPRRSDPRRRATGATPMTGSPTRSAWSPVRTCGERQKIGGSQRWHGSATSPNGQVATILPRRSRRCCPRGFPSPSSALAIAALCGIAGGVSMTRCSRGDDHAGLPRAPFPRSEGDGRSADVDPRSLPPEDIGLLTRPVEPAVWLANVRARYAFVTGLDEVERQVARCNPGDRYTASQLVLALTRTC